MDTGYLNKLYGLEGQVAVVTGGGGILCGTMARAFGPCRGTSVNKVFVNSSCVVVSSIRKYLFTLRLLSTTIT